MSWDQSVDFLVVGSGGGGMTAALMAHDLGMEALVIEKDERFGGTTAMSGGVIWVPNNHLMKAAGIDDSREEALTYLRKVVGPDVAADRLEAYVDHAPKMLRYLEQHSRVRYNAAVQYADYYAELPGGKPGGRSLDPAPISRRALGDEQNFIRAIPGERVLKRFMLTAVEAHHVMASALNRTLIILKRLCLYYLDVPYRLAGKPDARMTLGQGLIGSLRASLLDRRVPISMKTSLQELVMENGRVTGVVAERDGQRVRIEARKGVMLAAGGFARNASMRQHYQQAPIGGDWSNANPHDQGDGIRLGQSVGAALEFMSCAWWTPTYLLPDGSPEALIVGKSMPGCIFVNKAGRRFVNEAAPYEDVVKGQYAANDQQAPSIPCFMVLDARYRREYTLGNGRILPSKMMPDERVPKAYFESGFLQKGETLRHLAGKIGVDAEGLESEIARFNRFAVSGVDEDFHRGETLQDRYYSDANIKPNPTLAPIMEPPFYAITIYPGDLGTKGGLKCDARARVLNEQGDVIPGLYATGNCSGAVMGNSYPGAGATIGPAMTFGYIAARDAAGQHDD
ncbi:MAG TPA: FAD-binding protein [Pseudomonadales bacterium]